MTQFPVNKRRLRYPGIPALLLFWSLVGSVAYSRNYLQNPGVGFARIASDLSVALFCFWPWAFLGPLVFQLEKRFPLGPLVPMGKNRWLRNAGILLLAGLGICYLAYLMTALLYLVHALLFSLPKGDPWRIWQAAAPEMFFQVFLYVITVQAAVVFRNWMRLEDQERERAALLLEKSRLEASLKAAELNVLRMRLNPHFLFNTLQNVSVLAQEDPKVASQMLTRLGDLLRAALRSETEPEVPLSAEIALTESYLHVEKMRFADRLNVSIDLAPGTVQAMVPTLLLQPLVENAIRHGLNGCASRGLISIRSELASRQLVLTVRDNGQGVAGACLDDLVLGVGLASTRERLARMYKEDAELALRGLPEGGTEVRVRLPFRSAPCVRQQTSCYKPTQDNQNLLSRLSGGLPQPEAEGSASPLRNSR